MRLIQHDTFLLKSKPPFSEWPGIVHQFLQEQGLSYGNFYYYFDEMFLKGCPRAVKDCPSLGEPFQDNGGSYGYFDTWILSNIHTPTACTEADLLPLMKKLHRSYGFSNVTLYYLDVDFFGQVVPTARDLTPARQQAEWHQMPLDPTIFLDRQLRGSGLQLHRDILGNNTICMSMDLIRDGELLDPAPYVQALKALLPGSRHQTIQEVILSEDEKADIAARSEAAGPLLERVQRFFADRLPGDQGQNRFPSQYKVAPILKELSKQHGWQYRFLADGIFFMTKTTSKGQTLKLTADSGPSRFDTGFYLDFQGPGYSHRLWTAVYLPTNQAELDAAAAQVFAAAAEFEQSELLPELTAHFPAVPDWFTSTI